MKLTISHLGKVVQDLVLEEGQEYFAGRQEDCQFILEDETLSRKHVKIYQSVETQQWMIESLSDKKGLTLDGQEVSKQEIQHSSTFTLNDYTFDFVLEDTQKNHFPSLEGEEDPSSDSLSKEETLSGSTKVHTQSSLIYSLHISIEGESSDHISLNEGMSWVVGRSKNCDIYIDYNVLSREHLNFSRKKGDFIVTDLGTSNGSLLNGNKMIARKPYTLDTDDQIKIGDLNITFEVRNKDFEKIMSQLPVIASDEESAPSTEMAFPKIVLEESTDDPSSSDKKNFFEKKKKLILIGVAVLVIGFVLLGPQDKKETPKEDQAQTEQMNAIKESYNLAVQFLQQKKFQFCIDELIKLHEMTPYYLDSQQILTQCQNSSENQKRYNELVANKKKQKETEQQVLKMVENCKSQFDQFQTVEDLANCAKDILILDPSNPDINAMKLEIEERYTMAQMEADKKETYRKMIQSKKYLYNKAKKMDSKKYPLKTIAAYKVFLRSAKGVSGVASLYKQAQKQIQTIQKNYDDHLSSLYTNCESFIQKGLLKKAYYECEAILSFKSEDQKAIKYMKQARNSIREKLKDRYAESILAESLSEVDKAKKIWQSILEEDLKDGHYYKKAKILMKKHK